MEDSDIGWWLAITLFVAAALAYAYRLHKADSRRLAQLFTVLAAQYRGTMKKGSLFALPQLRFAKRLIGVDGRPARQYHPLPL